MGEHPVLHDAMFNDYKPLMTSAAKTFYLLVQGALLIDPDSFLFESLVTGSISGKRCSNVN